MISSQAPSPYLTPTSGRHSIKDAESLDAAISARQAVNTAVFWHMLASVDLVSSYSPTDMRVIERLYNKQLADGVEPRSYGAIASL